MTTIQKDPSIGDKADLDYSKGIIPYVPEEVDDFETEVTRFRTGEWEDPLKFTAYRLVRGVYGQRQADVQMVRIKMPSGSLTSDQRTMMRVVLPLASGFLVGSFVGAFTVKTTGLIPGVVATATGGFGVWLLLTFVVLTPSAAFDVFIRPHGPKSTLDLLRTGTVTLDVGRGVKIEKIGPKGHAHFPDIPSEFDGKSVAVRVDALSFEMENPKEKVTLEPGRVILVPMSPRVRIDDDS